MNNKLIEEFQKYLEKEERASSTVLAYVNDIIQLDSFNNNSFLEYKNEYIKKFLSYLEERKSCSKKTLSRKLNSINSFFKFLNSEKKISLNPAKEVSYPKFKSRRQRILQRAEYQAIRNASRDSSRLNLIIEILLQTGIRISELSNIKLKDIDFENRSMRITGINQRDLPLNDKIYYLIKEYIVNDKVINPESYLFRTKNNNKIQIRNLRSSIDKVILKSKIKSATVNDIRNTFIYEQLQAGISIKKVSKIAGHKNINSTKRYLRLLNGKYKESGMERLVEI